MHGGASGGGPLRSRTSVEPRAVVEDGSGGGRRVGRIPIGTAAFAGGFNSNVAMEGGFAFDVGIGFALTAGGGTAFGKIAGSGAP